MKNAVASFRASLKLDSTIPAQFDLAQALAGTGDSRAARQILEAIPRNDSQYASAQRFLASLELNNVDRASGAQNGTTIQDAGDAQAAFLDGQLLYQNQNYGGALKRLEQALRLEPQASWVTKAQIYRAVCLEKLARSQEAESAIQTLLGNPAARGDVDLQLAFVELLYESGRSEEALKQVDEVIAVVPQAAMVYFWRARVLLQLHQTDQAGKAAEESIRLLPELPQAHNLLLKIYQMQGHAKEAAEQAQWLRDYERRKQ
jgi:tetratricopeptide (TPR) repeat protein